MSKQEAYAAVDDLLVDWVMTTNAAGHELLIEEKFKVYDAIDAAVNEAYIAGYRDGRDGKISAQVIKDPDELPGYSRTRHEV